MANCIMCKKHVMTGYVMDDKCFMDLAYHFSGLVEFRKYWQSLYGQGLEVINWHLNGEAEPLDNFIESALDAMIARAEAGEARG